MDDDAKDWRAPPEPLALEGDDLHLWRASLVLPEDSLSRRRAVLSDEERARADRFHFERDRVRFVAAHGVLRDILGRYRRCRPEELRFEEGPHGKPSLTPPVALHGERAPASPRGPRAGRESAASEGGSRLEFNMSHSAELALYAVTLGRSVGVDVERIREEFDWEGIARRFFHPDETARLLSLPAGMRRRAFFSCWSCKEAYIKARGEGLSIPTKNFTVVYTADGAVGIGHVEHDPAEAARWSLFEVPAGHEYAGAVAVEGSAVRVARWEWIEK